MLKISRTRGSIFKEITYSALIKKSQLTVTVDVKNVKIIKNIKIEILNCSCFLIVTIRSDDGRSIDRG